MAALPRFKPVLERLVNRPITELLAPEQKLVDETREPLPILRVDQVPNILRCKYEGLQAPLIMWADERPEIPGSQFDAARNSLRSKAEELNMADLAQTSCPSTLGQAVETMFGRRAWAQYDTLQRNRLQGVKREAELSAQAEQRTAAENAAVDVVIKRERLRCDGQLVSSVKLGHYTPEDADAYCTAHALVAGLEARNGRNGTLFSRTVVEQIIPALKTLVDSAQSKAHQLPAKDRNAYERWQNGSSALAMDVMMRLFDWWSVRAYGIVSNSSLLSDARRNAQNMRGYNPAAGSPLADLYKGLLNTQIEQIRKFGMFEPNWYRHASNQLTASAPEMKVTTPGKPTPSVRESRPIGGGLVFLTPGQYAAASFGRSMGQAFGSLAAVFIEVSKADERAKSLTARIDDTGQIFWACEVRRCNDGGRLMGDYILALTEADINDSMKLDGIGVRTPHEDPRDSRQWAKGVLGCGKLWQMVEDAAQEIDAHGHKGMEGIQRLLKTTAYADYASCRDQAEFLARPRFILSGG